MKLWWRIFLSGMILLAPAQAGCTQNASDWRMYGIDDGMHQSHCVSVSVAPNGKVLALHRDRSSVTELDGYSVKSIFLPEPANAICAGPGNQLWATVTNGLLRQSQPGAWTVHLLPEIAAESNAPAPFCSTEWGQVLFLRPDGLMTFRPGSLERLQTEVLLLAEQTRLGKFTDMEVARDGGLWITGEHGLGKVSKPAADLNLANSLNNYVPPQSLQIQNLRAPRENDEGGVTVVAESLANGQNVVARFDGLNWMVQPTGTETIRRAWRSGDKVLWEATMDALFQQEPGQTTLAVNQELSARQYYEVAMGPGGTFWLATSGGLFHYAPPLWRSPFPPQQINFLVRCLAKDRAGRLWFIATGRLHSLQGGIHREFAIPEPVANNAQSIRALFPLKNGLLLLDAGENSIQFDPDSGSFGAGFPVRNDIRRVKLLGLLPDGSLCVQSWNSEAATGKLVACRFDRFDGVQFEPLADPPPVASYSTLFAARNGDLWLSGDNGVAWYHVNKWRTFQIPNRAVPEVTIGFMEPADGRIWCATQDRLWEFNGRNWSLVRDGFDHINAFQCAHDGSVWVADDAGVHRFFQKIWIENGQEEGLPDNTVNEILEDQHGTIWVATPHGLSRYHPDADQDPPRTFIQKPQDNESRFREGDTITIVFDGQDKWKFTPRDRLLYSCKLDYGDWSTFAGAQTVSLSSLPAGQHVCQIRAMDRNGNIETEPALVEFAITLPWYKEIRLVFVVYFGAAAVLFFAMLALNSHRRLLRSYAEVEKKVADRTRELEIASRELALSQKMTALGTLAAGIAHDFNNILSIIKGSAQIIEENSGEPQKIRTRVDRIKTVVEQGAGIVNAMLGFSSGAGEQPGACDLNAITRDTLRLLGDRFLREVEVKFEPAPDLPEVRASKNFIQQILLNFIFNAGEAMTARKQVVLSTQKLERLPDGLVLAPAPARAHVSISVRDSGCGIPPENLPRIFEPFFTTKALSARRGTGLGLSMVYELAKKMGAGIAVESVVNQGSTFALILPVQELPGEAKA